MENKNLELSADFFRYCLNHPYERFWQAFHNWGGFTSITAGDGQSIEDTFYWNRKNQLNNDEIPKG